MTELIITRGLPASGKTTWAKDWVDQHWLDRARVNRDDLRLNLFGHPAPLPYQLEQVVTAAQQAAVRALLKAGRDVVVDDTHLKFEYITAWYKIARELGADFSINDDFLRVPLEECIRRDRLRDTKGLLRADGHVGEDVIRDMHSRIQKQPLVWKPPVDFSEINAYQYEPELDKPMAWMVDIDGTLAKMGDRGPFEWHRVGEDEPVEAVRDFVNRVILTSGFVVLMSGRDSACRTETEDWLDEHGINYDRLYMRAADDSRKDAIVKLELFQEYVARNWNIIGVLDDRDQVVEMWRSIGLPCFQVAPGNF